MPAPGPCGMLCLFVVLGLLAALFLFILPEPWRRALLKDVWPLSRMDAWLREQIK